MGVALIVSGFWLYRKNNNSGEASHTSGSANSPDVPFESREAVMDAILAVDDLYQEGKLPEEAYLKRRLELKDRLKDMIDHEK